MSRQFKSTDTEYWTYRYGSGAYDATISGNETHTWDGATRFQANGIFSGTAGQTSFTKPGGWTHTGLCLLHQTQGTNAGQWELSNVNFSGASAVADKPLQNTYGTGAQIITLSNGTTGYHNVTINGGVTLSAPAWNGTTGGILAILASGTVTITGAMTATGKGFRGGSAGVSNAGGFRGEGTSGDNGTRQTSANGNGGGGGGGNEDGGGGGGGHAAAGTGGSKYSGGVGGTGGAAVASENDMVTMFFGGGGGGSNDNASNQGPGGAGGGVILIISKTVNISGSITSSGANGTLQTDNGGGGGGGGSVLIKGQNLILGTTLIGVAAGNGTGGAGAGGAGSVGRIHADYSTSITGTTSPSLDSTQDKTLAEIGNFFAFF